MSAGVGTAADCEPRGRSTAELAALAVLGATLWAIAGPTGAAVAVASALGWYVLGTPYALAVGFVGLTAAFPTFAFESHSAWLAAGAYGLLLLAAGRRSTVPFRFALAAGATSACLVGVGWLFTAAHSLAAGGVATLTVGVGLAYAVHRYERARMAMTTETSAAADDAGGAMTAADEATAQIDREGGTRATSTGDDTRDS